MSEQGLAVSGESLLPKTDALHRTADRLSGYLPAAIALSLPVAYVRILFDPYILPRASIVVAGACLGVALALRIPHRPSLGELRLPLLAAVAAALLAFIFSTSWAVSLVGSYLRYESLPVRLAYLGLLVSSAWLIRTQHQRDWLVGAFVAGTCVAAIEAWLQWVNHAPGRPDGGLGNATLLGALAAMAIPLAIDRARRSGPLAAVWAGGFVVLGAGLFLTSSRSGVLGAGAGGLALLAFSVPKRWGGVVAAASVVVVVIGVVLVLASPLRVLNNDPPELRLHLWADGLSMVAARPITGFGEDTTGLSYGHFLKGDYTQGFTSDRIHSGPLDIAAMQGVLGLAALGWVIVVVFLRAWRHRERRDVGALAAALVAYTVWVVANFDWAPATGVFWLLAGALWSAAADDNSAQAETAPRATRRALAPAALVAGALILGALPVLADAWYSHGRSDLAVLADPLQAQYHWGLGDALIARNDFRGGAAELWRAADLGETEPQMYSELGDLERQLGDSAAARRAYNRALQIYPYYAPAIEGLQMLG